MFANARPTVPASRGTRDAEGGPAEPSSDDECGRTIIRRSSQQHHASPKASRESNRRATTAFSEHREKRPLKTYGAKDSLDTMGFYGQSDDEEHPRPRKKPKTGSASSMTNRETLSHQEDAIVPGDPAASRVEAMLNNYDGGEDFLTSNWSLGSFPSIHTSVQSTTTPKTPKTTGVSGPLRSQQSTIPTITDNTPAASNVAHPTGSSEFNASNGTISNPTLSTKTAKKPPTPSQESSRQRSQTEMDNDIGQNDDARRTPALQPSQASERSVALEKSLDINDELASTVTKTTASTAKRKASKTSQKPEPAAATHSDELVTDDLAGGPPKEQYQPRPSRSRSNRNDEDLVVPEDFSKRPEVLAKKKASKRRKTTALARPSPKVEIEDDDDEDEDLVFLPPRTSKKAKSAIEPVVLIPSENDHVEVTEQAKAPMDDEHPLPNEAHSPEKVPHSSPPKKKRGRPRKPTKEQEAATEPPKEDQHPPTDDDDDLPAPEDLPKKGGKGRTLNTDTDDSATAPIKKSRQKRKADTTTPAILPDETNDTDDAPPPASADELDPHLSQTEGNRRPPPPSTTTTASKAKTADPASLTTPPKTPQKAAQPSSTAKGPDKHSPLNSSKVKFRVGLSKRARIEPLLKVVRK